MNTEFQQLGIATLLGGVGGVLSKLPIFTGAKFFSRLSGSLQHKIRKAAESGDETIRTFQAYMSMSGSDINVKNQTTIGAVYYLAGLVPGYEGVSISTALLSKDQADAWLRGEGVE